MQSSRPKWLIPVVACGGLFFLVVVIGAIGGSADKKENVSAGGAAQTTSTTAVAEASASAPSEPTPTEPTPTEPPTTPVPTEPPTTPPPTEAPTTLPPVPGFGDGTLIVGTDMPPGRYISAGGNGCYWERLSDASGGFEAILANDNADGQVIVDILPTDRFFSPKRCGQWKLFGEGTVPLPEAIGDGSWAVNAQLPPGEYRNSGGSGCYWSRLSGFSGDFSELLANDNVDGQTIVAIAPTDVGFTSKRCGTWQKIG